MGVREHLRDFLTIMKFNLKIETRYPLSYASGILNMFFWLLSFSILAMMLARETLDRVIIGNLIIWGFVAFIVFQSMLAEVGFGIVRLQRRGTLEQIVLTPVSYWILPLGLAGFSLLVHLIFIFLGIIFLSIFLNVPIIVRNPICGLITFGLLFCIMYGFALFLAGWTLKTKRASWALVNVLQILYMLFCGVFYPFKTMPKSLLAISRIIPLSYAVDLFRTTIVGIEPELLPHSVSLLGVATTGQTLEWIIVTMMAIISILLGYIYFIRTLHEAKKKGYLATY